MAHQYLNLLNVFSISLCLPSGSGIPPTQLSKYRNLGHVNISVIQEPLAFILPKKDMVFCLDEKEPVLERTVLAPEPPAPAPEVPVEESSFEPLTPASPEGGQEQAESVEPLQAGVSRVET